MDEHTTRLAKQALKRAKDRWGTGWLLLSDEQREGALAREVAYVILGWIHHESTPAYKLCTAAFKLLAPKEE